MTNTTYIKIDFTEEKLKRIKKLIDDWETQLPLEFYRKILRIIKGGD